jgi:hypothetical protein
MLSIAVIASVAKQSRKNCSRREKNFSFRLKKQGGFETRPEIYLRFVSA